MARSQSYKVSLAAVMILASCAYRPPVRTVPYGQPQLDASGKEIIPEWKHQAQQAIREKLNQRYQQP